MVRSPWHTSSVFSKIKHCGDGFVSAFKESSLKYCCTIDACMIFASFQREDNAALYAFCSTLPIAFELVNSAIERAIDRYGYAYHELAKEAKDISAAASMLVHSAAITMHLTSYAKSCMQ